MIKTDQENKQNALKQELTDWFVSDWHADLKDNGLNFTDREFKNSQVVQSAVKIFNLNVEASQKAVARLFNGVGL